MNLLQLLVLMKKFWALFMVFPGIYYSHSQWSLQTYMEARVSSEKDTLSTNLFSKLDRLNVCDHLPYTVDLKSMCTWWVLPFLPELTYWTSQSQMECLILSNRELFLAKLNLPWKDGDQSCLAISNALSLAEMTHSICRVSDQATKLWQNDGKCL